MCNYINNYLYIYIVIYTYNPCPGINSDVPPIELDHTGSYSIDDDLYIYKYIFIFISMQVS